MSEPGLDGALILSTTLALCTTCGRRVQARVVQRNGEVHLEKHCPEHGRGTVLLASDAAWYRQGLKCVKPNQPPRSPAISTFAGCPESCGFCPEHQQHACLPVIEIGSSCNLKCPICLKRFSEEFLLRPPQFRTILERLRAYEGSLDVINLSGGEPTLHPDLENFLELAGEMGVTQVSVSTNGIRLHEDRELRTIFKRHRTIVALQFDGFSPEACRALRGRDLTGLKLELVRTMEEEEIPFSLVCTVQAGLNDAELPRIADFFFESGALTIMFQPLACTGQASGLCGSIRTLTTTDVIRGLAGSRYVDRRDILPLPCAHPACFAMAYYFRGEPGEFLSLREFLGDEVLLAVTANRTLPGLDREGWGLMRQRVCEVWSAADSSARGEAVLARIRKALRELQGTGFTPRRALEVGMESMKAVFIHQFMDRATFDFSRIVKCCNPYALADGRLVPMCAQNVFFQGRDLPAVRRGTS